MQLFFCQLAIFREFQEFRIIGGYKGRERWGYFKSLMMVKDKNGNGEKQ